MTLPVRALPSPPTRQDPSSFYERADAFVAALPALTEDINEAITAINAGGQNAGQALEEAKAAAQAAVEAAKAQARAAAESAHQAAGSLDDMLRRLPDVQSIIDALATHRIMASPEIVTGAAVSALPGRHYALAGDSAVTLTAPASAMPGALLWITPVNGRDDNVFNGNGCKIMGQDEPLTLDVGAVTCQFVYIDETRGWWIL